MELIRTEPIEILYLESCNSDSDLPLFDDSKFRHYHLYEGGSGTIRIVDYENTPFEFFKVKWSFENDVLTY